MLWLSVTSALAADSDTKNLHSLHAACGSGHQEILGKFEFLPVRCRVQRAMEFFAETVVSNKAEPPSPMPTKVRRNLLLMS